MTLEMVMWITDCITHVAMIFAIMSVWVAIIKYDDN